MSTLTASQLDHFRKQLDDRAWELRRTIGQELLRSDEEQYGELAGRVHDSEEEAVADLLVDINLATLDCHVQALREVETARQRLAAGHYGVCSDCGGAIGVERLQVQPAASRCYGCQTTHERQAPSPHPSL
jgi:RNA polymerase-binding protein DksA